MTIQEMPFSKEAVSKMDLDHFKQVIDGYVKSDKLEKPTDSQVKLTYEKLTGVKVPDEKKTLTDK
jgi:hypothetical protein